MPGFEDSAFIVLLALLLFGPKKLPELARQLGKIMADFRRASSEFRSQMEDELRISDEAERQKKLAASSSEPQPSESLLAESPDTSSQPVAVPALDAAQLQAVEDAYANQDLPPLEASSDAAPQTSLDTAIPSTPEAEPEVDFKATAEFAPTPASPHIEAAIHADESAVAPEEVHHG